MADDEPLTQAGQNAIKELRTLRDLSESKLWRWHKSEFALVTPCPI